ncbi:MAG TPA: dihydrodipicolinate reductase C-terminal domain-containing protein [Bacteroidales bacterium]|nr:dihydrodipicolinate reductase C-terminal domain-containing protein [Bacteroidales bacterium]
METLRIALFGYGKMGKMIEKIAVERGHQIACIIEKSTSEAEILSKLQSSNIPIDFTIPDAVDKNMSYCFSCHKPLVMGTTGWHNRLQEITEKVVSGQQTLFYAPNFSLGMNIAFRLNQQMARLLNGTAYTVSMREVYHVHKLDAPSGTAIKLATDFIACNSRYKSWTMERPAKEGQLLIEAKREGEVNGIHEITAQSAEDIITLRHEALGREGFALGAVLAAEYIFGKTGVFTMDDLLKD